MTKKQYDEASIIDEHIKIQCIEEIKIKNLYELNKTKCLTSEDIKWLIEIAHNSNTYIRRELEKKFALI